ncbi:MAG: hypothetical protein P4L40_15425 [Terracidiphilus sp.]|nr:hypothetical protein [Terracidiphilus sp.]
MLSALALRRAGAASPFLRALSTATPVPPPSSFGPVSSKAVEPRFLEMVKLNFDKAFAATRGVDKDSFEMIKSCNSMLRVNFPLRRDNGTIEVGLGQGARHRRVQHQ